MFIRRAVALVALPALALAWVTFHRQWQFHANNAGRSASQLADGGYIASGGFQVSGSAFGAVLVRTDSLGETTSVRTILDLDQNGGLSCRLLDGGYAVLAKSGGKILVRKFSAADDSSWTYRSSWGGQVSAFIPTFDGGCLIAGRIPDTAYDMGVIKLAADGHEEWTRHYHAPFLDESWARGAAQTRDSGFVLCGEANDYLSSNLRLVRLTATGDTVWTRLYHGPVGPMLSDVRELSDSGFLAVGYEFDTLNSRNALYMMRTTSDGAVVWTRQLAPGAAARAAAMCATRDGGFAIVGRIGSMDLTRAWLVKTDSLGDTVWTAVLEGTGQEVGNDIEQTDDGGYLVAGTSDSAGGSILLIKTDSLGGMMVGVAEGRVTPAAAHPAPEVYPNPTDGAVNIHLPVGTARSSVRIYDARGNLVYSEPERPASGFRLDMRTMPAGVYHCRLEGPGFLVSEKLVKMQ